MLTIQRDYLSILASHETRLWNSVERALRQHDGPLSMARVHTMDFISQHDGQVRIQEISAGVDITVGAASRLVDRMVTDGLLIRTSDASDGRSTFISLSVKGRAAFARTQELLDDILAAIFSEVNPATITAVTEALGEIDQSLRKFEA